MRIINFLKEYLNSILEGIKDIDNSFFKGFFFILFWAVIVILIMGFVLLTITNWKISAWIVGIIIVFEAICYLGDIL